MSMAARSMTEAQCPIRRIMFQSGAQRPNLGRKTNICGRWK
jgi:hypothetical protein